MNDVGYAVCTKSWCQIISAIAIGTNRPIANVLRPNIDSTLNGANESGYELLDTICCYRKCAMANNSA